MATLLLSSAGAALGGAVGGPVGAMAGRALGAVVGSALDQRLLGGGAAVVETGRMSALRVQGAREGAPIPRVYGRMRVAAQVIWSSRFREEVSESGGGKGQPRTRSHRYSVSLALALCEGPIDRVGRIWVDGRLLDRETVDLRVHRGGEDQQSDPLIAAVEGADAAPAYRGVAYLVLSDLDLTPFGGRIPQVNAEVFRQPAADGAPLRDMVRAVALSPGSGEFALNTTPVRTAERPGVGAPLNMNTEISRADAELALDALAEEAPNCEAAALIVSWFGDDLRVGRCTLRPKVESREKTTAPLAWSVNGLSRADAQEVGQVDGRPVYGGAPADSGVVEAVQALRARGVACMFYPFILMDVAPGNGLPDPYGAAEQPAYPWRGRITTEIAAGRPGSTDATPAAEAEVAAFFGQAQISDFVVEGTNVRYVGPEEWGLRRFILHYALLCAAAGGVDSFCIGSELRGLTWIRSAPGAHPAVPRMQALARDVRAVLGPATKIGYAADWSEYFGHHPQDGSGDVTFHLDPLWADDAVDFIGIDNYMPLADWRDGPDHADAALAEHPAELGYLRANIEGGEGFDWFYASDADRAAQRRTPITDGAFGEPWVYRYKDLKAWWGSPHHDRRGGVRAAAPTAWVPRSKPFWFTEIGCSAVDKGPNQPNVFVDPKSSENALPYFSTGAPDVHLQRRFLQAALGYWATPARNPTSPIYGGPMLDMGRAFVWTWDLRPWPDFPGRQDVWSDGPNHRLGHWISGRMGGADLAALVATLCAEAGVADVDIDRLHGVVEGFVQERAQSARAALQPLMTAFGFDAAESGGTVAFSPRGAPARRTVALEACVDRDGEPPLSVTRGPDAPRAAVLRLGYADADAAYEPAAVDAPPLDRPAASVEESEAPLALSPETAQAMAARWRAEVDRSDDEAEFALPPSALAVAPGEVLRLEPGGEAWRVERVRDGLERRVTARRAGPPPPPPAPFAAPRRALEPLRHGAPPAVALVDDPSPSLGDAPRLRGFAFAQPWPGPVAFHRVGPDGATRLVAVAQRPAVMGALAAPAPTAASARWARAPVQVSLFGGALRGPGAAAALRGAGQAAIEAAPGVWEALAFAEATLAGADRYALGPLIRGLHGAETAPPAPQGAPFVLLDDAGVDLPMALEEIGAPTRWRVGPADAAPEADAMQDLVATPRAAAQRPRAPAHLRAAAAADGGVALRWVRRARIGGDAWRDVEPPLSEEAARWRVTLRQGARLLRVRETDAPAFDYAAAAIAADAAAGPVTATVAQLSARVGAGHSAEVEFDV